MPERKIRQWAHAFASAGVFTASGGDRVIDILSNYKTEAGIQEIRGKTVAAIIARITIAPEDPVTGVQTIPSRLALALYVGARDPLATAPPQPGIHTWPWMWYWEPNHLFQAREVAATPVFRNIELAIMVHVRAMRKITINEDLLLRVHNFSSPSVGVSLGGNVLLLG